MYLAWNLAVRERVTLYYDSAEELGRLTGFQWLFFASIGGQSRIWCVDFTFSFLAEENQKAITRLKGFGWS